ncbi:hypothetical protein JTB14_011615 [Gonioctena quinquepunctata]|nr:hypothetical protein JTB14_011615 [Gonioctena quinquepunctata]
MPPRCNLTQQLEDGEQVIAYANDIWKLPQSFRTAVFFEFHDAPTAGNLLNFKTKKRVTSSYYWPDMNSGIACSELCCIVCKAQKPEQKLAQGVMGRRTVSSPWKALCIDLMGPFPFSKKKNRSILFVCDLSIKNTLSFPIKSATSDAIVNHIKKYVFVIYGAPARIICDNGRQYVIKKIKDMVTNEQLSDHVKKLKGFQSQVRIQLDGAYDQSAIRYNLRKRPIPLNGEQVVWTPNYTLSKASEYNVSGLAPKCIKCLVAMRK